MGAVLFQSDSKSDLKLLMELAKKLGINVKELSINDLEDIGLATAMEEGKTGEYIDSEEYLRKLKEKL
jgi:hypothetical protein